MTSLSSVLQVLVTAVAIAGAMVLISEILRRAKPTMLRDRAGAIEPEKGTAWFTVIGGCVMSLFGFYGIWFLNQGWGGGLLLLLGLGVAGFMLPSLTSVHQVTWNDNALEGPSNMFGPTLGLRRTSVLWGDIAKIGTTITGYWYVESHDGRRVYWSYLYKGHGALAAFLAAKRPDLEKPASR